MICQGAHILTETAHATGDGGVLGMVVPRRGDDTAGFWL